MSVYKQYGIYGIVNKTTGKTYVGKTINNFGDRWDSHRSMLRGSYHYNKELQKDWNIFGEDGFDFKILYNCIHKESLDKVNELEQKYIEDFKNKNLAYNIHDGGDVGLYLGKHLSEEAKRKIGEKNRINMLGKHHSDETKKKMSESQNRRFAKWSDADRKAWGEKHKGINVGRKWNDSQREKMRGNKNGAKYTVEQVREIRRLHEDLKKEYKEISEIMNIPHRTVYMIATYRRWKDVI